MCRTIAIGTGRSAGSLGMTIFSACGPPVEMPITTMSIALAPAAVDTGSGSGAGTPVTILFMGAPAAALTFSTSSSATSSRRSLASAVGFCRKSIAPASSADSTCSPAPLTTLMMTIGIGRRAICARTNATPSISGMLRSHVMTSGRISSATSSASRPSRAVATTSRNGLRDSICVTTLRTYAESSTTRTLVMLFMTSRTRMPPRSPEGRSEW